jgi:hypothetical protein
VEEKLGLGEVDMPNTKVWMLLSIFAVIGLWARVANSCGKSMCVGNYGAAATQQTEPQLHTQATRDKAITMSPMSILSRRW